MSNILFDFMRILEERELSFEAIKKLGGEVNKI